MLRIHFGTEDLNRLRVAAGPDPLWETVHSLHLLQNRQAALVFDPWRREVRAALAKAGLTETVAALHRLCPWAEYFPDFLTPGQGIDDLETGIEQVLSVPIRRLGREIGHLYPGTRPLPPGARSLAGGDPRTLSGLGDALRRYHAVAVAPYAGEIRTVVAADRLVRADAALNAGPGGLLTSYQPDLAWRGDRLESAYPVAKELALEGRALTLIPSFFCVRSPVALADHELPPVLVHPLTPAPGWLARSRATDPAQLPVGQLIGPTRATVLDALERPLTTTQIGEALRITLSTASRHATVLRESGLVTSERRGSAVVHTRSRLGDALMDGRL
ncbi:ArsR/SmtB family transcription factor [Streptomyces sp. NBC_01465]|uniref:ArsR/SmtB family transcription factor n=1 Tax=Streptomyces sp. NBC_01465 TaxID=2903878 RepID=UPI002E3710A1|nr:helix-turn-helix domain-containing protein [Streptomyces sp. NBC_01465]